MAAAARAIEAAMRRPLGTDILGATWRAAHRRSCVIRLFPFTVSLGTMPVRKFVSSGANFRVPSRLKEIPRNQAVQ